jgi:hypothetical protein
VLQSTAVGSEEGELALSAREKAPIPFVFRHFFDDFLRVFR